MTTAAPTRSGAGPTPTGLRILVELLHEAVWHGHPLLPQPAGPEPDSTWHCSVAANPVAHRPTTVSGVGPGARVSARPGGGDRRDLRHGETIADEHAESWQLVRLAQDGDAEAFGRLYDRYLDVVFRFVYFRVNDRTLAEDITSETFLRALRRITSISYQGRDIGAWFVTIARNLVLDHLKSARHRFEITTADTIESREPSPSTESVVLASLQAERLMQAVATLGQEQRECIVLRFVQGMSVSETASIMGKNDGAIKALQHRAIRKLATLVSPELA